MKFMRVTLSCFMILFLLTGTACAAQSGVTLTVQADKPGAKINPSMWGLFFEDINFGADGGLYVELVKNRETKKPFAERKDKFKPTMLKRVSAELMKKGVYLVNVINTFLVAPPLIVTEEEINNAIDVFDEALKMADKETE